MNLYELTEQWETVLALAEEGADADAIKDTLESIEGEIEDKADGYAKVIRQLEGQAEIAKAEKDRLSQKETTCRNAAKDLKRRLEETMVRVGKPKIKTDLFSFNIQKNAPSVEIEDETRFINWATQNAPDLLKRTVSIDKTRLKDILKGGAEVKYTALKQSESLRIR